MIKQIGLPLRGRSILLITRMITDRIGLHSVLLPLLTTCDKIGAAQRRFASLQESRRTHRFLTRFFTCEQKPYPVWCGVGIRVILHSVNIT